MWEITSDYFRLFVLVGLLSSGKRVSGQCALTAACIDCYDWCPTQKNFCSSNSLIPDVCRVTCKNCPTLNEECIKLNCGQRCVGEGVNSTYTCACNEGFELDPDGRTCNDIDECERNPTICSHLKDREYCSNSYGNYSCTSCRAKFVDRMWGYYQRSDCCLRNFTSQCGKSSTNQFIRIVGGMNAQILAWPWMGLLHIGQNLCGGTLISEKFMLTAAHCVSTISNRDQLNAITILLGVENFDDNSNIHVQTRRAAKITIHPNYTFPDHDIAVIELDQAVTTGSYVYPICLPNGEDPPVGDVCYATGFGATRSGGSASPRLQVVDLPIINNEVCERAYQNRSNDVHPHIHLCAGYIEGGKDACQGDSGGPLVCQRCNNCDWYLAGITSFGRGCARPNFPGVYTRVTEYEEWVSQITNQPYSPQNCHKASWSQWESWSTCSVTCGVGQKFRIRSCLNGVAGSTGCVGKKNESSQCNEMSCDATQWSTWTEGSCSVTCGPGLREKTRTCENGEIGDDGCENGDGQIVTEPCNEISCPAWSDWGSWTDCSITCGLGSRQRSRSCETFGVEGGVCSEGISSESQSCSSSCWASWGQWDQCTKTCNNGTQMSSRKCLFGVAGNGGCDGSSTRTQTCNIATCDVWSAWGPCSNTCGGGTQTRTRGKESESRSCSSHECPTWEQFGPWSSCTKSCSGGIQFATRTCRNGEAGSDGCNGLDRIERTCNTFNCNHWTAWTYGPCSVTCGGGQRAGRRECTGGRMTGVGCVGNATIIEQCNTGCCPSWDNFEEYEGCPVTCGGGVQTARRRCICGEIGSIGCEGNELRARECGQSPCPGQWSSWVLVEKCSVSCGSGIQRERRQCVGGDVGGPGCTESSERLEVCNTQFCPTWGPFGEFGTCSTTCGGGEQTRTRNCNDGTTSEGSCVGEASETRDCNTQFCPGANSGFCSNLVNLQPEVQCCEFVGLGFCTTYNVYMDKNCRLSCCRHFRSMPCASNSGNQQSCSDQTSGCYSFRSICNLPQVFNYCRETCGLC